MPFYLKTDVIFKRNNLCDFLYTKLEFIQSIIHRSLLSTILAFSYSIIKYHNENFFVEIYELSHFTKLLTTISTKKSN